MPHNLESYDLIKTHRTSMSSNKNLWIHRRLEAPAQRKSTMRHSQPLRSGKIYIPFGCTFQCYLHLQRMIFIAPSSLFKPISHFVHIYFRPSTPFLNIREISICSSTDTNSSMKHTCGHAHTHTELDREKALQFWLSLPMKYQDCELAHNILKVKGYFKFFSVSLFSGFLTEMCTFIGLRGTTCPYGVFPS